MILSVQILILVDFHSQISFYAPKSPRSRQIVFPSILERADLYRKVGLNRQGAFLASIYCPCSMLFLCFMPCSISLLSTMVHEDVFVQFALVISTRYAMHRKLPTVQPLEARVEDRSSINYDLPQTFLEQNAS
jgi:hypothetical protein